jgi:pimeloyl-ACP methyl ester carboxylesterase
VPTFVASDGVRLSYDVVGDGPWLLLHLGAGCDATLWAAAGYLEPLATAYRCILYDHRGHGRSDRPTDPASNRLARFAADVDELLAHLDATAPLFWAYSNAISVGLWLADRPEPALRAIVGSGAISRPPTRDALEAAVRSSNERYRESGWEWLIAGFAEDEGPAPDWMTARIRATDVEPVIAWQLARLEQDWTAWESLERVSTPTLFVTGELEDPDDVMAEAAALLRDGRRVRVPGKGHINGFLDHEFVLPVVESFLAAHA